jgi:hypothetical protein
MTNRFLERALLFTMAVHLLAMISMALLLLPGVPGGTPATAIERAGYLADHPWVWRAGWFPWQLTALSDLILGIALVRTAWIPKWPALLSLVATVVAVSIEQPNELRWITTGVDLAREAVRTGDTEAFRAFEDVTYRRVSLWAATVYTIGAIGWSWTFAAARTWNRALTALSFGAWGILLFVGIGPLIPGGIEPGGTVVAAGNAVGFILMMLWFLLVTEEVMRRTRPVQEYGRYAPWRYPRRGPVGAFLDFAANAHTPRALGELVPTPAFASDITHVVYINYLVEATRLQRLVPPGLELQRLGPSGGYALFTFLTYRHGHFGPRFLGPLRRFLPSPIQSNWRIHVKDPRTGALGIYFTHTVIGSLPGALAARHLCEGVPMHIPHAAELLARPDGSFHLRLESGQGSAPDVVADLKPAGTPTLTGAWKECWPDFRAFLEYCVPQDRALSSQPWDERICRQEIRLGIPVEACEPLTGSVVSTAAEAIAGDATPLSFHVAKVAFHYDGERYD